MSNTQQKGNNKMVLFGKIAQTTLKEPVRRLFTGGFEQMGAVTRKPDTRTREELVQTIDYYTEKIPELKQFASEIKKLNQKHMGTVADTLELATHNEMLPTTVNLAAKTPAGVTYREAIVKDMIEASKTNPEAMELADAIINNTDSLTSKYALGMMSGGVLKNKELAKQMRETVKIVPDIARETLNGGYTMDYSKQENFMDMIKTFVNPNAKPDKITALFKDLAPATDKLASDFNIYMDKFVNSSTPMSQVKENIKVLPDVVKMLGEKVKDFDVVDFVTKNTNLI